MKKIICLFICVVMVMSLSSCKFSQKRRAEEEREKYVEEYEWRLKTLGAILGQSIIEDEKYSNIPMVTDRVQLPNSEIMVSLDMLRTDIYVYELRTGKETELTAEDIINLYSLPNEEKQAEFDEFFNWFCNASGSAARDRYFYFMNEANNLYKETYGKPFIDKDITMYTADERYALVKWGIENIEGNYYKKKMDKAE